MSKVLFLDIDGVLNNGKWAEQVYKTEHKSIFGNAMLYPKSLQQLKRIIDETGAQIVVSSSWRKIGRLMEALTRQLDAHNLSVADTTPYLGDNRGDDISKWLQEHPEVTNYAILDDDADMTIHMEHLVQTSFQTGLRKEEANNCIDILNNNIRYQNTVMFTTYEKSGLWIIPCRANIKTHEIMGFKKPNVSKDDTIIDEKIMIKRKEFPVVHTDYYMHTTTPKTKYWYRGEPDESKY